MKTSRVCVILDMYIALRVNDRRPRHSDAKRALDETSPRLPKVIQLSSISSISELITVRSLAALTRAPAALDD